MAKKKTTTYVRFELREVKSKVIYSDDNAPCYSHITFGALPRSIKFIRTWIETDYSHYTEDEVKEWCEMMKRLNFPVMYKGIKDGKYIFVLPVAKYTQKLHLNSGLTILRYLWENCLDNIPKHFFKIMKEVEGISEWDALLMAHGYVGGYGNSNHSLRDFKCRALITPTQIADKYKNFPIYNTPRPSISDAWMGKQLDGPASYTDRYKFLKANS